MGRRGLRGPGILREAGSLVGVLAGITLDLTIGGGVGADQRVAW